MKEIADLSVEELKVLVDGRNTPLYAVLEKIYSLRSEIAKKDLVNHMPAMEGANMGNFTDGDFMFMGGRRKQAVYGEEFRELPAIAANILKNRAEKAKDDVVAQTTNRV